MRRSVSSCRIASGAIGTSGRDRWRSFKAGTEIVAKAVRIWDQSAGKTPAAMTVERRCRGFAQRNSISVSGEPRQDATECRSPSTLQGAARFAQGGNTLGVVDERRVRVGGEVTANTTYEYRMHVMDSTVTCWP